MARVAVVLGGVALGAAFLALFAEPAGGLDAGPAQRPSFSFSAATPPAAVAGQKYPGFSFCKPPPPGGLCGAFYVTQNPRGGFPPYTFSLRNVVPGLHVNLRTGLLFGTVPKGAQKREWLFTVCATESRTPKYQQPRTRCDETSITIKGAAPQVTVKSYVVTMQGEAQKWRTSLFATGGEGNSCDAGVGARSRAGSSEMASFARRAATIPAPAELAAAKEKLAQSLTLASEIEGIWAVFFEGKCTGSVPAVQTKLVLFQALMLDWADAVVAAARAAGIAVDRASLLCCGVGG